MNRFIKLISKRKKFIKFGVVGIIAAFVDYLVLNFLYLLIGFSLTISATAGYICGVSTSYLINSRWTFGVKKNLQNSSKFILVNVISLLLTDILVVGGTKLGLYYNLAKLISIVLVFFWNYFANSVWVFRCSKKQVEAPDPPLCI